MRKQQDPYSTMTDEELDAYIAQQEARASYVPLPGQMPGWGASDVAAASPRQDPPRSPTEVRYTDLTDEELDETIAQEYARVGDGRVVNAENQDAATEAQTKWYLDAIAAGRLDNDAEWGTQNRPMLGMQGRIGRPGQWYVDGYGNLEQVPEDAKPNFGVGFLQGGANVLNNAAGVLEDGVGMIIGRDNLDKFNQWTVDHLGMAGSVDNARRNQQDWFEGQAQQGRTPGTGGRITGSIAATVPATLAAAVAAPEWAAPYVVGNGWRAAAGSGALGGALNTEHRDAGGIAGDAAFGAAGGLAFKGIGGALTQNPFWQNSAKQAAHEAGVPMSTGQILGYPETLLGKFMPGVNRSRRDFIEGYGQAYQEAARNAPVDQEALRYLPMMLRSQGIREVTEDMIPRLPPQGPLFQGAEAEALRRSAYPGGEVSLESFGRLAADPKLAIPDSIVPRRLGQGIVGAAAIDALAPGLGFNAAHVGIPYAAGAAAYTRPGQRALQNVLMSEPTAPQRVVGDIVRNRLGGWGLFGGPSTSQFRSYEPANPVVNFGPDDEGYGY